MKSRSVSITGATGFVGWHLCEAFRDAGWQVRAVVRPGNTKKLPAQVEAVEAPIAADRLASAFEPSGLVVHSAAVIRAASAAAFTAANVEGTRAVVAAANSAGARLVHLSSQAAIGPGTPEHPSREDDPPHPTNRYGRSKLASEALVREGCRQPWTIIRPCAVYGPRDRGFLPLFRLARRGLTFLVMPPATCFTFVFIDDLVTAIVQAAIDPRAEGGTFFVGHPDPQPIGVLMRALTDAYGRGYRPLRVPPLLMDALAAAGDLQWKLGSKPVVDSGRLLELRAGGYVCSVDHIRDVLGFVAPTPLHDGIARTARWYRQHGWT